MAILKHHLFSSILPQMDTTIFQEVELNIKKGKICGECIPENYWQRETFWKERQPVRCTRDRVRTCETLLL